MAIKNRYSEEWSTVEEFCEDELKRARRNLESKGLSEPLTEFERGRISALRGVLALADPETPPSSDTGDVDYAA